MKAGVSIPDGDVWFFKFEIQPKPEAAYHEVSIPDGDVWFFKCRIGRVHPLLQVGFQSPMGMYGFSNGGCLSASCGLADVSIPDGDVWFFKFRWPTPAAYPSDRFNPRWGCMVFQISTPVRSATSTWACFNPRWGCMVFQMLRGSRGFRR